MSGSAAVVAVLVGVGAVLGRPRPARWSARRHPVARFPPRHRSRSDAPVADDLDTLPDLVDLLAVAAAAGLPALPAVVAVVPRAPAAWHPGLAAVLAEVDRGRRFGLALGRLVDVHGDLARPLVAVLRAALDDGEGLAEALGGVAADARDLRRRRAEEAARRLPVRLLLPLVTCSLPAAAVLTVVPIVAGALEGLRFPT